MRKILFWIMLLIVLFLVVVIGVAAQQKTSPKAVLQDWFSMSSSTGSTIEDSTGNYIPTETQSGTYADITASGNLSDQDKQDTENFIDSLIQ